MMILAIDLGKHNSVACIYDPASHATSYRTLPTRPQAMHDLIVELQPQRVVFETGTPAGWLHTLAVELGVPQVQVANPNDERWHWRKVPIKTDRKDALKLAKLSAMDELPTVWMPDGATRGLRRAVRFRADLVAKRTQIRNQVRTTLEAQGIYPTAGAAAFGTEGLAQLRAQACPMPQLPRRPQERAEVELPPLTEFWRIELTLLLDQLASVEQQITQTQAVLDELGRRCARTTLLRTIPGVGPRLSEMIVAVIGDPHRFRNGSQVGSYAGLTPRLMQSGQMHRSGRISKRGDKLLRSLLVEIRCLSQRHNPVLHGIVERVSGGDPQRRKKARVAAARRLLVIAWAMLRHGRAWDPTRVGGSPQKQQEPAQSGAPQAAAA